MFWDCLELFQRATSKTKTTSNWRGGSLPGLLSSRALRRCQTIVALTTSVSAAPATWAAESTSWLRYSVFMVQFQAFFISFLFVFATTHERLMIFGEVLGQRLFPRASSSTKTAPWFCPKNLVPSYRFCCDPKHGHGGNPACWVGSPIRNGMAACYRHFIIGIMVGPGKDSLNVFEDSIFQYDPCCTRPEFHEAQEGQQRMKV